MICKSEIKWFIENVIMRDNSINPLIELRAIANDGTVKRMWESTFGYHLNPQLTHNWIDEQAYNSYNIFIGTVLRNTEHIPAVANCLWIDIDFKDKEPRSGLIDVGTQEIIRLVSSPFAPSVIIDSGHGYHAYWSLTHPVDDLDMLKDALKRLATFYRADRVYDTARVMRLPGTNNMKNLDKIVPCRVLNYPNVGILRLWDFAELTGRLAHYVPVPSISEKLTRMIAGDTKAFKSRSEADFAVVRELIALNRSEDEIIDIFETEPIGEKYREKGHHGQTYLMNTISAAIAALEGAK